MGHFTGRQLVLHIAIALLGAILLLKVGGNIMWFDPPPFETVTDASNVSKTKKQVTQGSLNEELSCNFSLTPDLDIISVTMIFRGHPAVTFVPKVLPHVETAFTERFDAVWVPNKLTLIIFNVTSAEEGEYRCEVVTKGTSARTWIRNIQLLVVDERQTRVSTLTASEAQRQTTVSFTATEDQRQTMVTYTTGSRNPFPTTASTIRTPEVDIPWGFIGAVVGVVLLIAIVCFWKWGKCFKREEVRPDNQQGNEEIAMQVLAGDALL